MRQTDPGMPPQRPSGEWAPGPPSDAVVLQRLRQAFSPHGWGILYDGRSTWTATNRPGPDLVRTSPTALRVAIEADSRTPPPRAPGERSG